MRQRTLRHYDIEWTMAQEQVDRTETSMHRTLPVRSCSAGATVTQIGKHENISLQIHHRNMSITSMMQSYKDTSRLLLLDLYTCYIIKCI